MQTEVKQNQRMQRSGGGAVFGEVNVNSRGSVIANVRPRRRRLIVMAMGNKSSKKRKADTLTTGQILAAQLGLDPGVWDVMVFYGNGMLNDSRYTNVVVSYQPTGRSKSTSFYASRKGAARREVAAFAKRFVKRWRASEAPAAAELGHSAFKPNCDRPHVSLRLTECSIARDDMKTCLVTCDGMLGYA
jgi:hypothetical protein